MICLRIDSDDGTPPNIVIGLDAEAIAGLQAGKKITIDLSDHGGRGYVVITAGEEAQDILDELREAGVEDVPTTAYPQ